MAAIATVASVAATGLQMGGAIMGAMGQREAAHKQASMAATAAEYGRAKAFATDAAMQQDLRSVLGNIAAVRAAANTNPASPSGQAVEGAVRGNEGRNRRTALSNIRAQVSQDEKAADFYRSAGRNAILTGLLSAATIGVKGLASAAGSAAKKG